VTNPVQIKRICAISGTALPQKIVRLVDRYGSEPAAMKQAGIAFATEQIIDLFANGINAVHVYSMNKPDVAEAIRNNLSEIIK
jgi:methylenetetrahydrofolate reductase (NADPH)